MLLVGILLLHSFCVDLSIQLSAAKIICIKVNELGKTGESMHVGSFHSKLSYPKGIIKSHPVKGNISVLV